MSYTAMDWAFEQECADAQSKLVLLAIAKHANERGESWPSIERIAKLSNMNRRTVERRLATLKKDGLVIVKSRSENGKKKTNLYKLPDASVRRIRPVQQSHRINQQNKSSSSIIEKEDIKKQDWGDFTNGIIGDG